jgi:hypothetical protein
MTLNPLGFALESFDALGRFRTEERVFGDDGSSRRNRSAGSRSSAGIWRAPDISSSTGAVPIGRRLCSGPRG